MLRQSSLSSRECREECGTPIGEPVSEYGSRPLSERPRERESVSRMFRVPRPTLLLLLLIPGFPAGAEAQRPRRSENVVLIVTDGLRWQEVFHGADSALANRKWGGVEDTVAFRREFVRPDPRSAREALLPFIWSVIGRDGQLLG